MITRLGACWILLILKKITNLRRLQKQKALDADPKAIQQIIFTSTVSGATTVFYIFEQSKETIVEFAKETTKVL